MSFSVARSFGRGLYFAHKVVTWEILVLNGEKIEEGKRGCYSKTRSWFNDEGVLLAAREWISGAGENITAFGLAKAIGEYLDSQRATAAVQDSFGAGGNRIRARTARRWLKKLGLGYGRVQKGVYVDGHEGEDVVSYRNTVFIPRWKELERRFVQFKEDGSWEPPKGKCNKDCVSRIFANTNRIESR